MGSLFVPPLRRVSYRVMSSLPLGLFAPWHPKHDSFSIGATSLMKLTGSFASARIETASHARRNTTRAKLDVPHGTQQGTRGRTMAKYTPYRRGRQDCG